MAKKRKQAAQDSAPAPPMTTADESKGNTIPPAPDPQAALAALVFQYGHTLLDRKDADALLANAGLSRDSITADMLSRADLEAREKTRILLSGGKEFTIPPVADKSAESIRAWFAHMAREYGGSPAYYLSSDKMMASAGFSRADVSAELLRDCMEACFTLAEEHAREHNEKTRRGEAIGWKEMNRRNWFALSSEADRPAQPVSLQPTTTQPIKTTVSVPVSTEQRITKENTMKTATKSTNKTSAKDNASKGKSKAAAKDESKSAGRAGTGKGGMSALDAAARVLKESKHPLDRKELVAAMLKKGYWSSSAPTPHQTVSAAIYVEINKRGKEARFTVPEKGKFGLAGKTY